MPAISAMRGNEVLKRCNDVLERLEVFELQNNPSSISE